MGKRFDTLNLHGVSLRGQDLRGAIFDTCNLHGADFTGANLAGAVFDTCNLHNAVLPSSALLEARFDTCNLHGVRYVNTPQVVVPPSPKPQPKVFSQGATRPAAARQGESGGAGDA